MYILKLLVILHLLASTQIEARRKIFAGEEAKDTKGIPSIVQLVVYQEPKNIKGKTPNIGVCGGSYIRPNWVISASHCVKTQFPLKNNKPKFDIDLCMGSVAAAFKCPEALKRSAHELHPYNDGPKWSDNDIMLVKILKPWVIGPTIQIIELEPPKVPVTSYHKKQCQIAGWGRVNVGQHGTTLRQGTVIVSADKTDVCELEFPNRQVCVKGGTAVTCQGDSGGPLRCDGVLVGVLKEGIGPCNSTETKLSVFNRIDSYRDWIVKIAGAGNSIVPNKLCLCIFSIIPLTIFN